MTTAAGLLALAGCAQPVRQETSQAPSGAQLFKENCARCHGVEAQGDGPDSHAVGIPVPDLTLIARRNQGEFPSEKVFRIIDGQWEIPAHGTRPMPVWGYDFYGGDGDDESEHHEATARIDSLVKYLASLQR